MTSALATDLKGLLAQLGELLPELRERYGIGTMAVFGSRVRDDFTAESDLDLLVTFERPVGLFELVGMEQELSDRFGVKVDVLTPTSIKPRLKERILGAAVPV